MGWLLRVKHWHLFLLTCGIPLLMMVFSPVVFLNRANPGAYFFIFFILIFIVHIVSLFFYFSWIWSIAIYLQGKIPTDFKMKTVRFNWSFFSMLFIFFVFIASMASIFFLTVQGRGEPPEGSFFPIMFLFMFLLQFVSMFCLIYCNYFSSKAIKIAEQQKEVKFEDFAAEFFLLLFYPVGVWFLQPRINKITET